MDRLGQMEVLLRVAEAGSFTAAARELGIGQPAVSKAIAALEQRLGARLLHRRPGRATLTDAGTDYVDRVRGVIDLIDEADAAARRHDTEVHGTIRVTTSAAFGRLKLVPPLLAFMRRHPGVRVELDLADADVDLFATGLDLAIRIGRLPDSALAARRLGNSPRLTVATREYLARHGKPTHPRELVDHDCVLYTRLRRGPRWWFTGPDGEHEIGVRGRLYTDSSEAARAAVLRGIGIGHFPAWLCADALRRKRLVALFPRYRSESLPVHALFPERRLVARRTVRLVDALAEAFAKDPDLSAR
jgi:DNA-binding transcriptional LysR family regulator